MMNLFLDFDGVLFDTWKEAYAVAHFTGSSKVTESDLKKLRIDDTSAKKFFALRPYVGPAWNYFYVLKAIQQHSTLEECAEGFLNERSNSKPKDYAEFERNFFKTRSMLKSQHFKFWNSLNQPYPFLSEVIKLLQSKDAIKGYIVTTKDKETVTELLTQHNAIEYFSDILGKEEFDAAGGKATLIRRLITKNTDKASSVYIDDSIEHIESVSKTCPEIRCLIPDWGYVLPSISTYSIDNIVKILKEEPKFNAS